MSLTAPRPTSESGISNCRPTGKVVVALHVVRARDELVAEDLVAHRAPLTQVLSLPDRGRTSRGGLASLGEIFQALGQSNSQMRRQP